MAIWKATYLPFEAVKARGKRSVDIEAESLDEAKGLALRQCPPMYKVGEVNERKRRSGGGRPPKHGEETRSIRVPLSISTELCSSIPELQAILDSWEEKAASEPASPRYHYLRDMIAEIRALGF